VFPVAARPVVHPITRSGSNQGRAEAPFLTARSSPGHHTVRSVAVNRAAFLNVDDLQLSNLALAKLPLEHTSASRTLRSSAPPQAAPGGAARRAGLDFIRPSAALNSTGRQGQKGRTTALSGCPDAHDGNLIFFLNSSMFPTAGQHLQCRL
jgi:hypothetical protein